MPTDTFRRFVDVLAESLDEAPSPDGLAARLHLSRFHVDRLVRSAAGETPAALRRRVLLERAAHRLLTTDDEVLAVALDAGFDSHEGFTRAFGRAYGVPPSRWRTQATGYRLGPPVFSYGGLLAHVLTFAAHRRTLVCGALWSAGITDLGAGDPRELVSRPG